MEELINEFYLNAEKQRKKFTTFVYLFVLVYIASLVLTGVLSFLFLNTDDKSDKIYMTTLLVVFIGIILAGLFTRYLILPKKKSYLKYFKENLIKTRLQESFEDLEYEPEKFIDKQIIINTTMIKKGHTFYGDDLIKAKYKGKNFVQSDFSATSNSRGAPIIFKGRWLIFDCKSPIENNNILIKDKKQMFLDIRFNNKFNSNLEQLEVFSYKPIEENILPQEFLKSLEELQKEFPGQMIIGLIKDKMHIALYNNYNAFEPSLFSPIPADMEDRINLDIGLIKLIINKIESYIA